MEPFSTSVFKDLTWIIATTTKICTRDRSTLTHASSFLATTAPSYTLPFTRSNVNEYISILTITIWYRSHATAPSIFRAGSFGRWVVTHSLADDDFHVHRPAVFMNQHLLWVLMSVMLGTLTKCLVHPTSPVLLTKNGPLGIRIQCVPPLKRGTLRTHLKFENKLRTFRPQYF